VKAAICGEPRGTKRSTAPRRRCATRAIATATRTYGMFSCSKATNEMNYIAQKFARCVIGSNNIDSCNRT